MRQARALGVAEDLDRDGDASPRTAPGRIPHGVSFKESPPQEPGTDLRVGDARAVEHVGRQIVEREPIDEVVTRREVREVAGRSLAERCT